MAEHQNNWPDRRVTVLAPSTTLVVISTLFALWRVIYGIKTKRKGILCDVLLSIAVVRTHSLPLSDNNNKKNRTCRLNHPTTDPQHRIHHHPLQNLQPRPRPPHFRPQHRQTARRVAFQLLPLDRADPQHARHLVSQILHLHISAYPQLLETVSGHRLGKYPNGDGV